MVMRKPFTLPLKVDNKGWEYLTTFDKAFDNGKKIDLGIYGFPESHTAYVRFVSVNGDSAGIACRCSRQYEKYH